MEIDAIVRCSDCLGALSGTFTSSRSMLLYHGRFFHLVFPCDNWSLFQPSFFVVLSLHVTCSAFTVLPSWLWSSSLPASLGNLPAPLGNLHSIILPYPSLHIFFQLSSLNSAILSSLLTFVVILFLASF